MTQERTTLLVAILASFVSFLDGSVVNVALPAIAQEFGGGLFVQQWTSDAYLITLGAFILIAGSLADLFGQRLVLKIGLYGFLAASILCAIAPNGLFLILARGVQGIAGAFLVPSSLSMIISTFKGAEQGKAIGTWTAWTGIAFLIGPLVGGLLVDTLSWRWIFAINIFPIAATLLLLQYVFTEEHTDRSARVDYLGAFLCSVGLAGLVYALIEKPGNPWSDPLIFVPLVGGLILLGLFLFHEKNTQKPMLPLSLFRVRNFSVGNIATFAIYGGLSIALFLITIFMQETGHYSALAAGMATVPVTIIMFFLSSWFGKLSSTHGPRLFMGFGPIIAAIGFVHMYFVDTRIDYWSSLFPGIALFGLGLAVTVAPLTTAVLSGIDAAHSGIGSAVNNSIARIAGLIAIAAVGIVIGQHIDVPAFKTGMLAIAALLALGGVISLIGIQNPKKI